MSGKMAIIDPNGNPFKSIAEMCNHWEIEPRLYYDRIGRGYTMKQALGIDKKPRKRAYTAEDLHNELGIKVEDAQRCIDLGLSLKDIKRFANGRLWISSDNKVFRSFGELCKKHNVSSITVKKRLAKGLTLEEALEQKA